ncbi:MOSC domain-containing protein [Chondrinema litorale]|uniref:MOSC domain-containing protein n=1 Tax=Chondrinema litorale TaxID=2994555 RepID=UPI002543DCE2|nr:MOSC domain-containing protein [Chondrinema litorale]UZR93215.1 MOSC domain-containing protein [Chondrinema litorale]
MINTKFNNLKMLMEHIPQIGNVTWIGVRPATREKINELQEVTVDEYGLVGDRYKKSSGNRAITLIQQEHLPVIQSILNLSALHPSTLRRNIVVKGINLLALKDKKFKIGTAVLEMTGYCHPCSRMEEALGDGGYNAMRGHGGITAKVIENGKINIGDEVSLLKE